MEKKKKIMSMMMENPNRIFWKNSQLFSDIFVTFGPQGKCSLVEEHFEYSLMTSNCHTFFQKKLQKM